MRLATAGALSLLACVPALGNILTFEGLADQQPVDRSYSGVTFLNAAAGIAGFSLNEAELPPVSGVTVALNSNGPIAIDWAAPVSNFNGFFTYTSPLTLRFFLSGALVGRVSSTFSDNLALSGDPGSSPNDPLFFTSRAFDSLQIEGSGSYGFDDISFDAGPVTTPEPAAPKAALAALLLIVLAWRFARNRRHAKHA